MGGDARCAQWEIVNRDLVDRRIRRLCLASVLADEDRIVRVDRGAEVKK
jgi:hypothetical protein